MLKDESSNLEEKSNDDSKINYVFKTDADFDFYVLNAVAHDFIHDFNNYDRMGKILNEIKNLVPENIQKLVQQKLSTSQDKQKFVTQKKQLLTPQNEQKLVPQDEQKLGQQNESEDDTVEVNMSVIQNLESEEPTYDTYLKSQVEQNLEKPGEVRVANNIVDLVWEETQDTNWDIDITLNSEDNNVFKKIINTAIYTYNSVTGTLKGVYTRFQKKQIEIIQNLEEFIDESKLVVINNFNGENDSTQKKSGQRGGNAINIITKNIIINAIETIIEEIQTIVETRTNEVETNELKTLINYFKFIKYTYDYISIPEISPLEIFTNSIINECASIYILGQCSDFYIEKQAIIILDIVIASLHQNLEFKQKVVEEVVDEQNDEKVKKIEQNVNKYLLTGRPGIGTRTTLGRNFGPLIQVGGKFINKTYNSISGENKNKLNNLITFESNKWSGYNTLLQNYLGEILVDMNNVKIYYEEYDTFVQNFGTALMKEIAGENTVNIKMNLIRKRYSELDAKGKRQEKKQLQIIQQLVDTINDLVFEKTLNAYKDIHNKLLVKSEKASGKASRKDKLTPEAKKTIRNISQLIAKKVLQTTNILNITKTRQQQEQQKDLLKQIDILSKIAEGSGYTTADDELYNYFDKTYQGSPGFVSEFKDSKSFLETIKLNTSTLCRVINNAIPFGFKEDIKQCVVCPTSSVCDGMKTFGSCGSLKEVAGKKEFFNMDFYITSPTNKSKFYYGSTNIKSGNLSVSINYGFSCNELQLYISDLIIDLSTSPIVLEANYTFKNVVNQIVEIWKTNQNARTIDDLWELLEFNEYFLSILKIGSQKAVGDIFQEINSTLSNGGYEKGQNGKQLQATQAVQGSNKQTYGLAGDRPSAIRMIKLLKDSGNNAILPKTISGYIGVENYLLYDTTYSLLKRGGKKTKKLKKTKKKYKTKKHKKNSNTKKRKTTKRKR